LGGREPGGGIFPPREERRGVWDFEGVLSERFFPTKRGLYTSLGEYIGGFSKKGVGFCDVVTLGGF